MSLKVLIASHGRTASGLASTVKMFVGDMDIRTIDAYVEGPDDTYDEDIREFLDSVGEDGAYIFTDFYGGSVNQHVTTQLLLSGKDNIRLISNINVPTIIDILTSPGFLSCEEIEEMVEDNKTRIVRLEELGAAAPEMEDNFLD